MWILSLILWGPVIGAAILALVPKNNARFIRGLACSFAGLELVLSWGLIPWFDMSSAEIQFGEAMLWNKYLGSSYALGVDGFSFPMVLLATLLTFVALLASAGIRNHVKGYYLWMMILEAAMLGVFMSQDWALFYIFWELTLIPLFFLIDRWGGRRRHLASLNFVLYTMGGSIFMLVALLVIYASMPEESSGMVEMAKATAAFSSHKQLLIFLGFLIGFGVKMPIFPIHGWLPLAHVEAPSPVSILLSGILLKMGSYGLIRVVAMLPDAAVALQGVLMGLALLSLIYGGLLAWRQSDLKAMIAYSSVSHMGVVLLGMSTLNETGLIGATLQMVAHGLVAGSLFLLIGLLYERTHTREVGDYSSLVQVTPGFAFFTTVALLASMGMPGTVGFVAELHALVGGVERFGWWMLLLSLGVLISAAYAVRTVGRLFTGPVRPSMQEIRDLGPMELAAAGSLGVLVFIFGFSPSPMIEMMSASVTHLSAIFSGRPM